MLLFLSLPDEKFSSDEIEMFYDLGGLLQMVDDIFDLYDDLHGGTITPATLCGTFEELEEKYSRETRDFFDHYYSLLSSKPDFIYRLLFSFARAFVCLSQFRKTEKKFNVSEIQKIAFIERSEMICDMGKLTNILLNLQISRSLNRKIL